MQCPSNELEKGVYGSSDGQETPESRYGETMRTAGGCDGDGGRAGSTGSS